MTITTEPTESAQTSNEPATVPVETVYRTGRVGRRAIANAIDGSLIAALTSIGVVITAGIYTLIASATTDCALSRDGRCDPSIWLDRLTFVAIALWTAATVMLTIVRPVLRNDATIGMRQVGIEVVTQDPGRVISRVQGWTRAVVSHPVVVAIGAALLYLGIESARLNDLLRVVLIVAVAVMVGGSAALMLAPGHRSLADAATNTRVVHVRPMSAIATLAAAIVPIPALGVVATLIIGASERPAPLSVGYRIAGRNYENFGWLTDAAEDFFDLAEWFADGAVRWLALGAVWVALAALSWLALRHTRWQTERRAGRGLALTAAVFAALSPLTLIGIGAWELGSRIVEAIS